MERVWTVTDSMGNLHQIMFKKGFGGAECNLVVVGNKIRLAVNGTYLEDGTPYEPIRNIPTWINVLTLLNFVFGWFMFGLIGFLVTFLLDLLTYKLCLSKKITPAMIIQIAMLVVMLVLTVAVFALV